MDENECMLTTVDNPFDPFTQFRKWYMFDVEKGYNTCGKLARIVELPNDLSSVEENMEVNRAIDQVIKYDVTNLYRKVYKNG